jgi:hypothetical protein
MNPSNERTAGMAAIVNDTQKAERERRKTLPSVEALKSIFDYDPATGVLTWRKRDLFDSNASRFNTNFAGKVAGSPHQNGYLQVAFTVDEVKHKALVHRVCFKIQHGYVPDAVDHANNIRTDNRAENLRDAGANGNQCNRSTTRAKSGLKGVYFHTASGRLFSQIKFGDRYEFLGTFDDEREAAQAYDTAALRLHGEFARTNQSLGLLGEAA